jgi:hypothetical protein
MGAKAMPAAKKALSIRWPTDSPQNSPCSPQQGNPTAPVPIFPKPQNLEEKGREGLCGGDAVFFFDSSLKTREVIQFKATRAANESSLSKEPRKAMSSVSHPPGGGEQSGLLNRGGASRSPSLPGRAHNPHIEMRGFKYNIFMTLEHPSSSPLAKLIGIGVGALILLSTAAFILESLPEMRTRPENCNPEAPTIEVLSTCLHH